MTPHFITFDVPSNSSSSIRSNANHAQVHHITSHFCIAFASYFWHFILFCFHASISLIPSHYLRRHDSTGSSSGSFRSGSSRSFKATIFIIKSSFLYPPCFLHDIPFSIGSSGYV
ncbi:hypothetical protein CC2G_001399 [Coprinopsis cinerea AmutBmut pab1-1]|nr:hypothetical protein CC2G_001399 [Coprinopsis cinerea AmutBmut pab1-1]